MFTLDDSEAAESLLGERGTVGRGVGKAETKGVRKQWAGRETEAERQRDRKKEMRYRKTHTGTQRDGQS